MNHIVKNLHLSDIYQNNNQPMKIISWNVNGIRSIIKKDFFEDISQINPDILCLQETKAQAGEVKDALSKLEGYFQYYNSADRKGYSGVAILSRIQPLSITEDMGVPEHDTEGRILCAEFDTFYLVTVYVPNSGAGLDRLDYRKSWDDDFRNYLLDLEKLKPVIICGDLNVSHRPIDLKNDKANYNKTAGYTQVEIDGMDNLIASGFVDTFRHFNPDKVAYSYWGYRFNARERNAGWRLDYFLVSTNLLEKIKSVGILSEYYGSDHCPVLLEID